MLKSRLLLAGLLAAGLGGHKAYGRTNDATPPSPGPGVQVLAQIRVLGLEKLKEEAVTSRISAREGAPYSEQDKALDVTALLASGEFKSVEARLVTLSSSSARLDFLVAEFSPRVELSTAVVAAAPQVSSATAPAAYPAGSPFQAQAPSQPAPPPPGGISPPWAVGDIQVQGNHNVRYNVIRGQIKARRGDLYQRWELDEDIKSLLGLGQFERVAADLAPLPGTPTPAHLAGVAGSTFSVRVTFIVEEKPLVRKIRFEGYKKISRGKLLDALTLKERDPLDRVKLKDDASKILQLYLDKGYLGASADPRVSVDTSSAQADVVYAIVEGPRSLVSEVRLDGVSVFKPKKVLKQMANRRKKPYQEAKMDEDLKKIEALYKNNGYLDFRVSTRSVEFSQDRTQVVIRLGVEEGKTYRFGDTTFSGNTVYSTPELAKTIDYRKGKIFSQERFDQTLRGVQELYGDKGYVHARVTPEKTFNAATGLLDVRLDVVEGNVVYVDHVDVEGNHATKTHVLKREIVVKPGQPLSISKVRKSQEKIMNLGFIDDVQPDFQSPEDPDKADLTFEVTEGKPGSLTAGAGFSSLDGLLGTLALQHMNVLGRAQRVSVAWSFGARVQDYSVSWTTPWLKDSPTSLGVDAFNTRRIRPFDTSLSGFTEKRQGGAVRLGPRFEDDKYQLNFSYGLQKIGVSNVQTEFLSRLSESTSVQSTFGTEFAIDTRDSFIDPTKGSRNSIGMSLAGGPILNGDIHFFKPFIANSVHYHLLSAGDFPLVLSLSNRASYVTQFNETKEVPVFERFFLGGQDTLRGYSASGEVGDPAGGKVYDVLNAELGFPLARERRKTIVKIVGFFDAGNAWSNVRSVHFGVGPGERDIKTDVGIGLRFVTPAFPIRLDYGYGLNHRGGERRYQINFGLGPLF